MSTITELLVRTSEIRKKHDLIAEMTGERFNIFSILGLQSAENRTHSAFLCELLDPKGSHGLRDLFLKSFIRMLRNTHEKCAEFKLDGWDGEQHLHALVEMEMHIGFKSEDLMQGGRIDLVISQKTPASKILIENKIFAVDQDCQLVRYRMHDSKAILLYLTLDGKEASKRSIENSTTGAKLVLNQDYFCISYKLHILEWLKECGKEAASHPLVRESIFQYANLIRELTKQNTSDKMSEEISTVVLRDKESLLAFGTLLGGQHTIREQLLKVAKFELHKLARQHHLSAEDSDIDPIEGGFYYSNKLLSDLNLRIGFEVGESKWFYGFARKEHQLAVCGDEILSKIRAGFGPAATPTPWWPISSYWKRFWNWDSDFEVLASIYFEKENSEFIREVNEKLLHMTEILRHFNESAAPSLNSD